MEGRGLGADRDWEWHSARDDEPDALRRLFDEAVAESDRILDRVLATDGLDRLSVQKSRRQEGQQFSLRWIVIHMIEEYARHNGHADLIRESSTGSPASDPCPHRRPPTVDRPSVRRRARRSRAATH